MYLVELSAQTSLRLHRRSEDYDVAANAFRKLRKFVCREVRMMKIENGIRILLKYISKVRYTETKE